MNNNQNTKPKPKLSSETRAYLSMVGKNGMVKRWGEKRPETATSRLWKSTKMRLMAEVPTNERVAWLSTLVERGLDARKARG